jgi:hypothetical protein
MCLAQEICIPAAGDIIEWLMTAEVDLAPRVHQVASHFGSLDRDG